jgi:hypothetical protein
MRDLVENAGAFVGLERGAEHFPTFTMSRQLTEKRRRDHHVVEPADDLLARLRLAQPPSRDIGQCEIAAEHGRRQRGQKAQERARLDHAGTERIGDHDGAVTHRLHQSGHAEARTRIELEWIGEVGVEASHEHLGPLEAGHRANEDAVVAHGQVFALDQQEAEITREIGVLEIGLVHRPRREHADAGIVLPVERGQLGLERLEKRRQPLDLELAIDVGHGTRDREPVLQCVAGARRCLRAVAEHPPMAVRGAADVDRIDPQTGTAGRRHADQRPQEFRIAGDDRGRQPALVHEVRRPVGVGQHRFEQFGALDQTGFERLPFRGVDQQRYMAQRPRPLGAGRILVHAIEHAGIVQVAIGGCEAPVDLLRPQRREHGEERPPMGAHAAVVVHHLVEDAGQRPIAGQERRDVVLLGSAVAPGCHRAIRPESDAGGRESWGIQAYVPPQGNRKIQAYSHDPGSARGGAPPPRRS